MQHEIAMKKETSKNEERLDVLLVKRNLAESRERQSSHHVRQCFCGRTREDKAGTTFPEDVAIEVRGHALPYVSRGGLNWKSHERI